ncbi:hypothetical protein OCL06_15125 [Alteromonas sp. ASW11-19]|uniref:DUF1254 domain-containing protein n=1 Tax=Alteromonas salexigens TaxID=2982530 RepID=A0ABT2VRI0_9ALTE|nr:hypothetical protein [Alteromonas salexigens]MCU7555920.1 hypothetical protein [Alteromonas salexigens]
MEKPGVTPVTAPPRHVLLEALLVFATAGLYLGVWFYLAARDCKRLSEQPASPLWWVFVPFIAIAQVFALPRFFQAVRDVQSRLQVRRWPQLVDYLWMAGFFGLAITSNISTAVDLSMMVQLTVFIATIVWFLPLHMRMNRIRRRCENKPVMPRSAGFNVIEWLAVVLFTPLLAGVFAILLHEEVKLAMTESYEPHTSVRAEGLPFRLDLSQTGWKPAEIGQVTDGTSKYELVGPLRDMWYAVFIYSKNDETDSLANNRYDSFVADMDQPECDYTTRFLENSTQTVTWIECAATDSGDDELYVAKQIQAGDGQFVELVGYLKASPGIMEKYREDFINDAKGFGLDE